MNLDRICKAIIISTEKKKVKECMSKLNERKKQSLDYSQFPNNFNLVQELTLEKGDSK